MTEVLATPFLAKYYISDVTYITSTTRYDAWLPQSISCRKVALLASANYCPRYITIDNVTPSILLLLKQVLSTHIANSAPNVVLLHRVKCLGDVCGPTIDR